MQTICACVQALSVTPALKSYLATSTRGGVQSTYRSWAAYSRTRQPNHEIAIDGTGARALMDVLALAALSDGRYLLQILESLQYTVLARIAAARIVVRRAKSASHLVAALSIEGV